MAEKSSTSMYPPGFSRIPTAPSSATVRERFDISTLPPLLRTILVADGTITKLLEAYLWEPIHIRVSKQGIVTADPFETGSPKEVLRRDVVLHGGVHKTVFAFARSVVAVYSLEDSLREALMIGTMGIGSLLRERRLETFREQLSLTSHSAGDASALLEVEPDDRVVERTYRIHHTGKPLVEITEIFPVKRYEL